MRANACTYSALHFPKQALSECVFLFLIITLKMCRTEFRGHQGILQERSLETSPGSFVCLRRIRGSLCVCVLGGGEHLSFYIPCTRSMTATRPHSQCTVMFISVHTHPHTRDTSIDREPSVLSNGSAATLLAAL